MAIKISSSIPDALAIEASETYHAAKGEEFGMSELVQVAFACLAGADDKLLTASREKVVAKGGEKDAVVLPGLKKAEKKK